MDLLSEIEKGQEDWAFSIAVQAYIWGYPLLECWNDRLKKIGITQDPGAVQTERALNAFRHARALSTADSSDFVNAATDFLYSFAAIDLRDGPVMLTSPSFEGRWYGLQVLDPYMETLANFGTRTVGDRPPTVVFVKDEVPALPPGAQMVRSGSDFLYIVGRIAAGPNEDLRRVNALQDALVLTTLPSTRRSSETLASPSNAVYKPFQPSGIEEAKGLEFFEALGAVLRTVPPRRDEAMFAALLTEIGFQPGGGFDASAVSRGVRSGLLRAGPVAQGILERKAIELGVSFNGWGLVKEIGNYDKNYIVRALVAKHGIWANVPEEAMYFIARFDHQGGLLVGGAQPYQLRFEPGQAPPVDAFWSVSSYDLLGRLSVNRWRKSSINSQYTPLEYGPDGSLTIRIGGDESTAGPLQNWLPAADGPFSLTLRCYNPSKRLLDLTYQLPPVTKLS